MSDGPLSGLKVIESGNFVSAPYCTKLMADLGAEVIKVEEPFKGDESRHHGPFPGDIPHPEKSGLFLYLNTNKLGITLNLKTASGRKIVKQLLKDADIFVENNPPGFLKELGLDYPSLKELNPRLIMTSITPFGQTGPYRDYKAYDINCLAAGGMSDSIGHPQREPLSLPPGQTHYQSGAHGAAATLVALFSRKVTGKGQWIDISETDVWCAFHAPGRVQLFVREGRIRKRAGHRTPGFYPYTILPCKDGYVSMIAGRGFQWKSFLELVGDGKVPDWYAKEPRFRDRLEISWKYADEVDARLAPWLMQHTKEEIFSLCRERGIPFTPVYTVKEVVHHPHLKERGYWVEVEHTKTGKLTYPGAPYKLSKTPWEIRRAAPLLGEHNEAIYCGRLGFSRGKLVRLRAGGHI